MENQLKAWKKEPETDDILDRSDVDEVVGPQKKLSPLDLLKQQMKENEVK